MAQWQAIATAVVAKVKEMNPQENLDPPGPWTIGPSDGTSMANCMLSLVLKVIFFHDVFAW